MAAKCISMVDFIISIVFDFNARVARDGEQCYLIFFFIDGGKHQRIASSDIVISAIYAHEQHVPEIAVNTGTPVGRP